MQLGHGSIFNGVSFNLDDASSTTLATILDMDQVKAIWPLRMYAKPAAPVQNRRAVAEFIRTKRADSNDTFPPHVQGNVNKLHAEGFDGAGVKIAVVDTGIDYKHPSLGGGFGPGFKVFAGTDLVGPDYTGENTPVPGPDPRDCSGHGTHVAGTVAAEDALFTGVAPKAGLMAYKVFGCGDGSVSNDVLIDAFAQAYKDGADLITASIGGVSGWSGDPWAVAVQRIVEAGVPCTIAAGNDGAQGLFYASGAADGYGAIAVGSVNNLNSPEVLNTASYTAGGKNSSFGYTPAVGDFGSLSLPVFVADPIQACTDLTTTEDLSGKLVLIQRGVCKFDDKVKAAKAKGAKNIMLFNNVPGATKASVTDETVNVGMVEPETGAAWIASIKAGNTVTVTFDPNAKLYITAVANPVNGGFMSTFSSWSPTYELVGRPHVSAPGGNILSTYPLAQGGYAVLSGTSMATPYIAGTIGLYIQNQRKLGQSVNADVIRWKLASAGRPLKFSDGTATPYDYYAPTIQQGSGIIDAYAFIHNTAYVDVDNLNFNDTQNFHKSLSFKIYNTGSSDVTYNFKNQGAATAYAYDSSNAIQAFPPELSTTGATVEISPASVSLKAGQSKRVTVRVTPPTGLDSKRLPVYSGWIQAVPNVATTATLNVAYMGVNSNMKDVVVTDGAPEIQDPRTNASATTFDKGVNPVYVFRLNMGSSRVLLNVASVSDKSKNIISSFEDKVIGSVPGFPSLFMPRNGNDAATMYNKIKWNRKVITANNQTITLPAGQYKMIYRALKISGRPSSGREYEKYESDVITLN